MEIFRLNTNEILYGNMICIVYDTWRRIKGVGCTVYFHTPLKMINVTFDIVRFSLHVPLVHPKTAIDCFIQDIALVN